MIGTSNIPIVIKDIPKQPSVGKIPKNGRGNKISNVDDESSHLQLQDLIAKTPMMNRTQSHA